MQQDEEELRARNRKGVGGGGGETSVGDEVNDRSPVACFVL